MSRPDRYSEMVGTRFEALTFGEVLEKRVARRIVGRFICDCGKSIIAPVGRVRSGRRRHCGCKTNHVTNRKHGMRYSPEYSSWNAMKNRCLNPRSKDYPRYGGAGISIHPEWATSFEAFYRDIGPRPNATTLDRIDAKGNYVPGNVRWAFDSAQASNRTNGWSVEIDGIVYESVEAAARAHNVSHMQIVRWCDGYTDLRRSSMQVPPRHGCRRSRAYE